MQGHESMAKSLAIVGCKFATPVNIAYWSCGQIVREGRMAVAKKATKIRPWTKEDVRMLNARIFVTNPALILLIDSKFDIGLGPIRVPSVNIKVSLVSGQGGVLPCLLRKFFPQRKSFR